MISSSTVSSHAMTQPKPLLYDVRALAQALSLSPATIHQYASKRPEMLPPRMATPHRKLLWAIADVEAWIERHRPQPEDQEAGA